MSLTGKTFDEFCRDCADDEREMARERRRYLRILRRLRDEDVLKQALEDFPAGFRE